VDQSSAARLKMIIDDNVYKGWPAVLALLQDELTGSNILNAEQFKVRLNGFVEEANKANKKYFVLLRCPKELSYAHVLQAAAVLSDGAFVEYGCVAGSYREMQIDVPSVTDANGNVTKSIRVTFSGEGV